MEGTSGIQSKRCVEEIAEQHYARHFKLLQLKETSCHKEKAFKKFFLAVKATTRRKQ